MTQIKLIKNEIERLSDLSSEGRLTPFDFRIIKSFIESLEKEQDVDLEKEIDTAFFKSYPGTKKLTHKELSQIARNFYELGCRHAAVLYDDIEKERQRRQEAEQPQGLDGAAEEAINKAYPGDAYYYVGRPARRLFKEGFKAGAKWMAEQGETLEVEVRSDCGGYPYIPAIELYDYDKDAPTAKAGDKVIVQIRKAE